MLWLAATLAWSVVCAQVTNVSEESVEALGDASGAPQMSGFVFVNGRYIPPPYTVSRKGNGIFVNRVLAELPFTWPRHGATGLESGPAAGDALDADGDFEVVAPARTAQPQDAVTQARNAIEDLFGDAPDATPDAAPAAPAAPQGRLAIDDLFTDDEAPAPRRAYRAPPPAPKPAPATPSPLTGATVAVSPEQAANDRKLAVEQLERLRKSHEQSLAQGEFFFFSQRHSRVNGTYGTARTMMAVLPKALRAANSPQELMQGLNQGGIYFLDSTICCELFRHKNTFPLLEERLKNIEEAETIEAIKRKQRRRW